MGPAHSPVLTTPVGGGPPQPKRRRAWGRDTTTPAALPPEERHVVAQFLKWLRPLRGHRRFDAMLETADRAAAGTPMIMEDYTPPLAQHQAGQKVGGSASRHSREFQMLFPEWRHKPLHLGLMNGIAFAWRPEEEQRQTREGSPGHDFGPGRIQHLEPDRFEEHRAHQKELRDDGTTVGIDPWVAEFYIRYFRIAKLDGNGDEVGVRHIHNCKAENVLQRRIPQKLTGVRTLAANLRRGHWQAKIDFEKWFHQHSVQWKESLRLCVHGPVNTVTGEKLEDDAMVRLPMGTRQAPPWASQHTQALVTKTNELGSLGIGYVDEIHQQSQTAHGAFVIMMLTAAATSFLGWRLGWAKMVIWPTITMEFLGLVWNTRLMRRSVRWGRRRKLCATALALFKARVDGQKASMKEKASFLGQMIATQPGAREFGLQATHLKAEMRQDLGANRQNCQALVWVRDRHTAIARHVVMSGPDRWWNHVRTEAPQATIAVDASCYAWGAQLMNPQPGTRREMRDRFTVEEQKEPHTVLEQVGAHRAVDGMAEANGYAGTKEVAVAIAVETDNQAVRAVGNKAATRSTAMAVRQLGFMRRVLDPRCLQLKMVWVSGETMVQRRSGDYQSRTLTKWFEWPLDTRVVLRVCALWNVAPRSLIDVFAERSTARARRYLVYEGDAAGALYRMR